MFHVFETGSFYVAQAAVELAMYSKLGLKLLILLPFEYWDCRNMPQCLALAINILIENILFLLVEIQSPLIYVKSSNLPQFALYIAVLCWKYSWYTHNG
jgi:hypothetical protein